MSTRILISNLLAPVLLVAIAGADTIITTDGHTIDDCTVLEESLLEVTYRRGGNNKTTIPTSDVMRIDFMTSPGSGRQDLALVDRAETAVRDGQLFDAVSDFTTFLNGAISKLEGSGRIRPSWAPAYAAWRLAQINASMGKNAETIAVVDKLVEKFPEARYLPAALLLKAEAQFAGDKAGPAKKSLEAIVKLVAERGISKRWELEAKLVGVVYDGSITGTQRLDALKRVATQAGAEFAGVRNRAQAIGAETLLADKNFDEAKGVFTRITKDPKSDQRTLAIAWSGLGDCFYQSGAQDPTSEANKAVLMDALKAYMRVVVIYNGESDYLARAMVYAGRIYTFMGTEEADENAKKLFGAVVRQFPGTKWAQEARGFAKKR